MKTLSVLGSTGSIGESTLDLVFRFPEKFKVEALAAGGNRIERLARQIELTKAKLAAVPTEADAENLRSRLAGNDVEICFGASGLARAATCGVDLVVSAIVGSAGLLPTYEAVKNGTDVALANKESLVAAGQIVMAAAEASGASIFPVDSEHSAIFQLIENINRDEIRKIILTASGGPFRGRSAESLADVSVEDALQHPNWDMGPKITVDSATMMNKGLEVIEAHWLFGLPPEKIDVVVHPQSVIHSMVEMIDGAILAQLGAPDMRGPISHALNYPNRLPMNDFALDLCKVGSLTFEAPDMEAFPCLGLAYEALKSGGTASAVLSAANEAAVAEFLDRRIKFNKIPELISAALNAREHKTLDSIDAVLAADKWARNFVRNLCSN